MNANILFMSNGLDVALMKDPFGEWSPEDGDRHTDIAFGDPEWYSFFFKTLGAKRLQREYGISYDDAFDVRDDLVFQESLQEYPLLARIKEFYRDASFAPHEVPALHQELKRAEKLTIDDEGRAFLDGMSEACDLALSSHMGISLLSS